MCGITGFWDFKKGLSQEQLHALATTMHEKIATRGPDDCGLWSDEDAGIVLAHRRLSILDLTSAGHQPMLSPSGRYVISYNGEVYNSPELTKELERQGFAFKGHSDTEVILAAIEAYGIEMACQKFVGMFAFVLWDQQEKAVMFVRDRMGKKPLYMGFHGDVLFFGSQLKSFFPHPKWRPEIDEGALRSYFYYSYIPSPQCIFKGIQKQKPGTIIRIDQDRQVTETVYWNLQEIVLESRHQILPATQQTLDDLHAQLKEAVRCRMISDVPLGAFLSGGIDSSLIVALMQNQSDHPIKTFSIGFREEGYNEAPFARSIAKHLGTQHTEFYLDVDSAKNFIPQVPEWFDEPFADSSQLPTYMVSKLTKQYVTVALSGDGGDELFAGYNRYQVAMKFWTYLKYIPTPLGKLLAQLFRALPPNGQGILASLIRQRPDRLVKACEMLEVKNIIELYEVLIKMWPTLEHPLVDQFKWLGDKPDVTSLQAIDMMTYLPDDIMVKVDRASMALSLESRAPLLDHRVAEMALRMPLEFKIKDGSSKWVLKEILSQYVPREQFERPKMGFGVPVGDWIRGDLKDWAYQLVQDFDYPHIISKELLQKRWAAHQSGHENWQYHLWPVIAFQAWKQYWKV